ncbi:MAG: ferritin-like domain-containing protein [Xanthobacteraceae bacterium]
MRTVAQSVMPLVWNWDYQVSEPRIDDLYRKSVSDQWSAAEALNWDTLVDPARPGRDIGGAMLSSGLVARLSPVQRERLMAGMGAMTFSQLLHGEQGALMVSANLVRLLPSVEMKQAAASQTSDEARHVDVFSRYIKRIGEIYPPSPAMRRVLDKIINHPLWLAQVVGMQIVVEGMALATFLDVRSVCSCPLLHDILDLVIKDEARHVAFGKIALRRHIEEIDADNRAALHDFTLDLVKAFRNWGTEPEDLINNAGVMIEAGVDPTDMIAAIRKSSSEGRPLDLSRGMRYAFSAFILPNLEQIGLISSSVAAEICATMPAAGDDLAALDRLREELMR